MVTALFADATSDALNPVQVISAVGFPIFTFLALGWFLVTGHYHSESEVAGLREDKIVGLEERQRLEAQIDDLTKQFVDVILPTVHDAVGTFGGISKILEQTVNANSDTKRVMDKLEHEAAIKFQDITKILELTVQANVETKQALERLERVAEVAIRLREAKG